MEKEYGSFFQKNKIEDNKNTNNFAVTVIESPCPTH